MSQLKTSPSKSSSRSENGSRKSSLSKKSSTSLQKGLAQQSGLSETSSQKGSTSKIGILKDFKKGTLSDYERKHLEESPLFQKIYASDKNAFIEKTQTDPSILITGFGMRNLRSLQDALQIKEKEEEQLRLKELYRRISGEEIKEEAGSTSTVSSKSSIASSKKFPSVTTVSTETEKLARDSQQKKLCLEYLLSLEKLKGEAEHFPEELPKKEDSIKIDKFGLSKSKPMREAQVYLLQHKILDFFQFIITHLLSASPDNPITFIMELLNKCLLYRSQLGQPSILYQKKHLEQLFHMMDRMKIGAIEMHQYTKGLTSLGICDFNENPTKNAEGLIPKVVFVEEAYKAQVKLFNELIKIRQPNKLEQPSSESELETVCSNSTGTYFMPTALFKPLRRQTVKEIKKTDGEN